MQGVVLDLDKIRWNDDDKVFFVEKAKFHNFLDKKPDDDRFENNLELYTSYAQEEIKRIRDRNRREPRPDDVQQILALQFGYNADITDHLNRSGYDLRVSGNKTAALMSFAYVLVDLALRPEAIGGK